CRGFVSGLFAQSCDVHRLDSRQWLKGSGGGFDRRRRAKQACADVEMISDADAAELFNPTGLLILEIVELVLVLLLQGVACGPKRLLEPFRRHSKAREPIVGCGGIGSAESVDYRTKLLIESLSVVGNVLRKSWQRGQEKNDTGELHPGEGYRKTGFRLFSRD